MTQRAGLRALALVAVGAALVAGLLFARLDAPLFWADEGETAMFAQRVLEYGYPKVHGERNVVYQFGPNIALGVKEGSDAYIGTTWGQFYFAALFVSSRLNSAKWQLTKQFMALFLHRFYG